MKKIITVLVILCTLIMFACVAETVEVIDEVVNQEKVTAEITLDTENLTKNDNVYFYIEFNKVVSGFDLEDITIKTTLNEGAFIEQLTGSDKEYMIIVTVNNSDDNGKISISIGKDIVDEDENFYEGGESDYYTIENEIIDKISPSSTISLINSKITSLDIVKFEIEFDEEVSGFTKEDITLGGTLSNESSINNVNYEENNKYTVEINVPSEGNGTININLGTGITDFTGNYYKGSESDYYTIENEIIIVDPKPEITYTIVDTGIIKFYNNDAEMTEPRENESFYGQDAQYQINTPSYTNNNDGTIIDNVTGLMWQQDMGIKITFDYAFIKAQDMDLGGYDDWRVPTIKELYSLIQFTGTVQGQTAISFFIDTDYFNQPLGDTSLGEREIDAQTWSSTEYVGKTMNNDDTVFGVNFIDGRIKGYPKYDPATGAGKTMYFRMVRGNVDYGKNSFINNGDETVSDIATGLMWQQGDSEEGLDWQSSLDYANNLELSNYSDWRLPNAKELQSIVDYTKSPQTTNSAAIDSIFDISTILDPEGHSNYPYFWTGTTHLDGIVPESGAVYIAFGEAQGQMLGSLLDVHGAGAQRSDPKSGIASYYPQYFGPQGDVRYVYNYVRCVRNID